MTNTDYCQRKTFGLLHETRMNIRSTHLHSWCSNFILKLYKGLENDKDKKLQGFSVWLMWRTNKTLAFALGWRQVLCSLPVSAHEGPSLAQMFTFFPSLCLLTTVSAPHFKLVVVMQRCLQIRTRCVINEHFCLRTAHCDRDTVCILNVTLTNLEAKRRGWKIGSIWLRPFKSCTNNLHSRVVWAIPLCSEGREKETERYSWVRLRRVWNDTVWEAESMFTQTYQIWLLTAGVIHFCPTRHECSARLGENLLSCCPSPLRAQELLPAQLFRSDKPSCPGSRGKQLCRESWSRRREVSSALLWPTLVPERQRKGKRLSHAGRTLLQSAATVLQPQKQAPLPLSPPTHTYIHSLCFTHTHRHTAS